MSENIELTDKLSLTQEIVGILKATTDEMPEGYTGEEWIEVAALLAKLDPPIILAIPWCVFDLVMDEFGVAVMESKYDHIGRRKDLDEDGNIDPDWQPSPKRRSRNDVLAILAWKPMAREIPDITIEDVERMMNNDNIRELTRTVFKFWGVDLEPIERQLEALADRAEAGESDGEAEEASDTENFTA